MVHTVNDAVVNAFVGDHVLSGRPQVIKPVELIPDFSSCLKMPASSSKPKAFVACRETDDVGIQIAGGLLRLVNFRKHANLNLLPENDRRLGDVGSRGH